MDKAYFEEMIESFNKNKASLIKKTIFLFGHSEASLTLVDLLLDNGIHPVAILDNNKVKYGKEYKGIPVVPPIEVLKEKQENVAVLIVARFYEAMNKQLRDLGFTGDIIKLVDYNTYAEYSLSEETRKRKKDRVLHGVDILNGLKYKYKDGMIVFCPFDALGDIYFTMSYLMAFLKNRAMSEFAICVPSNACAKVAELFGAENIVVLKQKELDATIQAVIYTEDKRCYIAHQDRPYIVNLHKALYIKKIPLETIYCCGVFGLPKDTPPALPTNWIDYPNLGEIEEGKTAILSPYAKSVTALPIELWNEIVADLNERGFKVYTNVVGDETPIENTLPISPKICEMKSVVERAGLFIGIRSGLCDIIRTANCRKIALYPDYNYCDTKWKAIDIYSIDGFENIVVKEGFKWQLN
jgi:hypothetical protein